MLKETLKGGEHYQSNPACVLFCCCTDCTIQMLLEMLSEAAVLPCWSFEALHRQNTGGHSPHSWTISASDPISKLEMVLIKQLTLSLNSSKVKHFIYQLICSGRTPLQHQRANYYMLKQLSETLFVILICHALSVYLSLHCVHSGSSPSDPPLFQL